MRINQEVGWLVMMSLAYQLGQECNLNARVSK